MPIEIAEEFEGCDTKVRFFGDIYPNDVNEYFDTIISQGDFSGQRFLIEINGAHFKGFSYQKVREFAALTKQFEPQVARSRTAIVANTNLAYGMTRMYISIRNMSYPFAVFRGLDKALLWLNSDAAAESQIEDERYS